MCTIWSKLQSAHLPAILFAAQLELLGAIESFPSNHSLLSSLPKSSI
jgi:hypothetical protein